MTLNYVAQSGNRQYCANNLSYQTEDSQYNRDVNWHNDGRYYNIYVVYYRLSFTTICGLLFHTTMCMEGPVTYGLTLWGRRTDPEASQYEAYGSILGLQLGAHWVVCLGLCCTDCPPSVTSNSVTIHHHDKCNDTSQHPTTRHHLTGRDVTKNT